jgi:NAD(P)-dependent dehydrogenase (short-subunit alcohol dehydrogenase family)
MTKTLSRKTAIITGAASGLGRASALAMADAGARLLLTDVNEAAVEETAALATERGADAAALVADAGSVADAERTVRAAMERFGALHVVYNNAGVALPGQDGFAPDMDPEIWDRVIRINLSGVFYMCHFAIPAIADSGGGSIINAASSMATLPLGGLDAYAASKGGVALLTKSLAPGCGKLGIRVNAIGPGYVDTPMNAVIWDSEPLKTGFALGHATGLQTAEEIADLIVFLASDASRSLTGALLTCDGGWTAFKQPELLRG